MSVLNSTEIYQMLDLVKIEYMYIEFGIDKTHEVQKLLNL